MEEKTNPVDVSGTCCVVHFNVIGKITFFYIIVLKFGFRSLHRNARRTQSYDVHNIMLILWSSYDIML